MSRTGDDQEGAEVSTDKKAQDSVAGALRFEYSRSRDCRTVPVQGAYGGLIAPGLIAAHLYSETPMAPNVAEVQIIEGEGQPESVVDPPPGGARHISREVQVVALMVPEHARRLARWLNDKCDELERLQDRDSGEEVK